MRRLQFRLRSLMILIALVAVGLNGVVLWRRSVEFNRKAWIAENDEGIAREYLEMAEEAAGDEEFSTELLAAGFPPSDQGPAAARMTRLAKFYRQRIDYYASRRAKYRRAARQPWLSVDPDPPLPEIPAEFAVP